MSISEMIDALQKLEKQHGPHAAVKVRSHTPFEGGKESPPQTDVLTVTISKGDVTIEA